MQATYVRIDTYVHTFYTAKSIYANFIINNIAEVIDFHKSLLYRYSSVDKSVWQMYICKYKQVILKIILFKFLKY